jgi:hypothetical protein
MMKKMTIAATALWLCTISLMALEEVELTGTYEVQVGCYNAYHEEISFVVERGKDKFSGIRHALSLTAEQKEKLISGKTIIKIRGKKQPAVTKKMTKAAVRQTVYHHQNTSDGMPLHCKDIEAIVSKIAEQSAASSRQHNHGALKLKPVEDDNEEVEVTIMSHIAVDAVEVVGQGVGR